MKIKIVHLITGLNTGGAEMMLYKLISSFNKDNFENIVISMMDKGTIGPRIEALGIKVYTLNMQRGIPSLRTISALKKILRQEKPNVIQTWMYHADLLGFLVRNAYKNMKLVWNIRCSNMEMSDFSPLTKIVIKTLTLFAKIPDAVIVNSKSGKDFHEKIGYYPKRWELIYNGFNLDSFHPLTDEERNEKKKEFGIYSEKRVIGIVARYDVMKGYDIFLQAAKILVEKYKQGNTCFLLIGRNVTSDNIELVEMIEEKSMKDWCTLLGERNNIYDILPMFDVYVSSSKYGEGFSNSIGEAMACGVPCVVTDIGDSAMIVGETGYVVEPNHAEKLAEATNRCLSLNEEEYLKLRSEARRRICEHFSIAKITKDYENLYNSL